MRYLFIITFTLMSFYATAQSKKKQDKEAIKAMCGCYEVTFNFAETFAPDKDYTFHDNYRSGGLEWVQLVEDEKNKISMQHLLIVGDDMIVKHWRQDWLYEHTELYAFDKENSWQPIELDKKDVKGQWTQRVFQVDDGPRYEGSASWVHVDGRHFWENTADSPLPRREFSKRSDYNVMVRTNRHEITADGWIHEQDNDKVVRNDNGDVLLAEEKGWNTYKKVPDSRCRAAQDWWADNEQYWADVRAVWDEFYAQRKPLKIAGKIEDKVLFQRIFALGDEAVTQENYNSESVKAELTEIIKSYQK